MKFKKFFISYRRLKTQKHSVSIGLSAVVFLFMRILIDNLLKQCLSKNILYKYFVVFCPVCDSFSSENVLYVIAWR